MRIFLFALFAIVIGLHPLHAQETPPQEPPFVDDNVLDEELSEAEGPIVEEPVVIPPPQKEQPRPRTQVNSSAVAESDQVMVPQFVKPPAPPGGGSIRVPHPNAAKGLIRINRDGSYQYKTAMRPKSQAVSVRVGQMTPPQISTTVGSGANAKNLTYEGMYGSSNLLAISVDYEWQPFTDFGRLGIVMGAGFATTNASGYFLQSPSAGSGAGVERSEESYNLFVLPVSLFVNYRFEYARRQWIVPFVSGGATVYGLIELRDDNKKKSFAYAPAAGGGGGVHFSISAFDPQGAFVLDREYGIADMYFTLEARVMQGLDQEIDFSTQSVNAGITVDF